MVLRKSPRTKLSGNVNFASKLCNSRHGLISLPCSQQIISDADFTSFTLDNKQPSSAIKLSLKWSFIIVSDMKEHITISVWTRFLQRDEDRSAAFQEMMEFI